MADSSHAIIYLMVKNQTKRVFISWESGQIKLQIHDYRSSSSKNSSRKITLATSMQFLFICISNKKIELGEGKEINTLPVRHCAGYFKNYNGFGQPP